MSGRQSITTGQDIADMDALHSPACRGCGRTADDGAKLEKGAFNRYYCRNCA